MPESKVGTPERATAPMSPATAEVASGDGPLGLRSVGITAGVLAVAWFGLKLQAAHHELGRAGGGTLTVAQAAGSLPAIMQSALLAGLGAGLLAVLGAHRFAGTAARRYILAGGSGAVLGAASGGLLLAAYGDMPQSGRLAVAVGLAVLVGALAAAVPARTAVAVAAVGGALGCFMAGTVVYSTNAVNMMLGWFGGGDKANIAARVSANGVVAHVDAIALGLVAGLVAFWLLRRYARATGTVGYLAVGAATGAMLLVAEPFIRIGGAALLKATRSISLADDAVVSVFNSSRPIGALLTLFAGAIVAMFAYGRSIPARRPSQARRTPGPRQP